MSNKKIIFIVGPTASGKTDLAFSLAEAIPAEIVSCDSMQVYREVSIATNKSCPPKHMAVKQHLVDIVSVREEFDVSTYNDMAFKAIESIHARGRIPLVVGGSGMYMSILLDGIFEEGKKDEDLRNKFKKRALEEGLDRLYQELKDIDPKAAGKIHPSDERRIIRALEVYAASGKAMSEMQKQRQGLWGRFDVRIFALDVNRQDLYKRIDARVEKMLEAGLVDEIRSLNRIHLSRTAGAIIGVKEIRSYLNGEVDLQTAIDMMKQNTRRLAKRQLTWFRRDKRLSWRTVHDKHDITRLASGMAESLCREGVLSA